MLRFCGAVVDSVVVFRYQIRLSFEDDRSITFSAPFCFGPTAQIAAQSWVEFPVNETLLPRVLGASIDRIYTDPENQLWIAFSSGDTLLVTWTAMYECYEFAESDDRTIV